MIIAIAFIIVIITAIWVDHRLENPNIRKKSFKWWLYKAIGYTVFLIAALWLIFGEMIN